MFIKYSPIRTDDKLIYEFKGGIIHAVYQRRKLKEIESEEVKAFEPDPQQEPVGPWEILDEYVDVFDFANTPDGVLENIETDLPINPIISAKRENGILCVELLNFISADASAEECFPNFMITRVPKV